MITHDMLMDHATGPRTDECQHLVWRVLADIFIEYQKASQVYPALHSAHEAYAVIFEELDEFWDEVRKQREARDPAAMRMELCQVAAMCLRTVLDLALTDAERSTP